MCNCCGRVIEVGSTDFGNGLILEPSSGTAIHVSIDLGGGVVRRLNGVLTVDELRGFLSRTYGDDVP